MSDEGSCFAADWLALREPVDHRSRAAELVAPLRHHLLDRGSRPVTIVDLGAGAGSNQRYLSAHLGVPARWILLDRDAGLLARAVPSEAAGNASGDAPGPLVTTRTFDLSEPLAPVLEGADLVTASALLDLVSNDWIRALCKTCAGAGAAVLMALTVDGRVEFSDRDPLDRRVAGWVAQDQRREKGLGLALGAGAPAALKQALETRGYRVIARASDWVLGEADETLAGALIDGWREAARRQCPRDEVATVADWAARRERAIAQDGVLLRVGHVDVLGLPPGPFRRFRS
ncbi:hypothetical protein CDEF62S_03275 [Castellaniella defragrans]